VSREMLFIYNEKRNSIFACRNGALYLFFRVYQFINNRVICN
jgi:hypothetical protein